MNAWYHLVCLWFGHDWHELSGPSKCLRCGLYDADESHLTESDE